MSFQKALFLATCFVLTTFAFAQLPSAAPHPRRSLSAVESVPLPVSVGMARNCPDLCVGRRSRASSQCTNKPMCRIKRCNLSGSTRRGYKCSAKNTSATPSPTFVPRFKKAVMCQSGRSVYNVGVIDIDDELHIATFAVTEETALEQLDCISHDRASVSVEEYLSYAFFNCVGEDSSMCKFDKAKNECSCDSTPIRCVSPPFRRAVDRCNLVG